MRRMRNSLGYGQDPQCDANAAPTGMQRSIIHALFTRVTSELGRHLDHLDVTVLLQGVVLWRCRSFFNRVQYVWRVCVLAAARGSWLHPTPAAGSSSRTTPLVIAEQSLGSAALAAHSRGWGGCVCLQTRLFFRAQPTLRVHTVV